MTEKSLYLCCSRVNELDDPVPDSWTTPCTVCQHPVWISPSSQQILYKSVIICMLCMNAEMRKAKAAGEPVIFGGLIPGQVDELKKALDNEAD